MAGECDNKSAKERFHYKGKFFANEDEFWKFVKDWQFMPTDQETFFREWDDLGKQIWLNIDMSQLKLSNGRLNSIFEDNFWHLYQIFFGIIENVKSFDASTPICKAVENLKHTDCPQDSL